MNVPRETHPSQKQILLTGSSSSSKWDSGFQRSKTREIPDFKGSREPFLQKKKREKDINERS